MNPLTQRALFDAHVADYRHLIDALGIRGCRILAFGPGSASPMPWPAPRRVGKLVGLNAYPPILIRRDALRFLAQRQGSGSPLRSAGRRKDRGADIAFVRRRAAPRLSSSEPHLPRISVK